MGAVRPGRTRSDATGTVLPRPDALLTWKEATWQTEALLEAGETDKDLGPLTGSLEARANGDPARFRAGWRPPGDARASRIMGSVRGAAGSMTVRILRTHAMCVYCAHGGPSVAAASTAPLRCAGSAGGAAYLPSGAGSGDRLLAHSPPARSGRGPGRDARRGISAE